MEDSTSPVIKKLQLDLSRFQVVEGNRGSERGEMLDKFLARVNQGRTGCGYPPVTMKRLAYMLSHMPTEQLYPFWKDCERARSFSAYFFWSLKPKKGDTSPTAPSAPSAS